MRRVLDKVIAGRGPASPTSPQPTATAPEPGGLPAPLALEVAADHLQAGESYARTLVVIGYPREVGPGWLAPLLAGVGGADATLHIEPIPSAVAADRLRRQLARLESSRRLDASRHRLADPEIEVAADDAHALADQLARGEGRLFRVGLAVTVHAPTVEALDAETERVRALLASLLLDARPATFRAIQGWLTTLPLGLDLLRLPRTLDTAALAAAFPFATNELPAPPDGSGVLYGYTLDGHGVVRLDRWSQPNYNAVVLARSGAGKSFLAKLEALRSLYAGVEVLIVDPEDEYARLARAVGGTHLPLGAPGVRVNPFDLDRPGSPDAVTRKGLFLHTLVAILLGEVDPDERAALDRAIVDAYAKSGISPDPATHRRPAPLLADLTAALEAQDGAVAGRLARRLAPATTGTHRALFDGPTTSPPADAQLTVWSLRHLPDELKPVGMLLALDAVWRQVTDPARRRRRLVILDEAWLLLRDPNGARHCQRLAKSARKHWAGITTLTQDAEDVLDSDIGRAVVTNAAVQILLGQAPQAIPRLSEAFRLTEGEQQFLLTAERGHGIVAVGTERAGVRVVASPREYDIATSDPADLAAESNGGPDGEGARR